MAISYYHRHRNAGLCVKCNEKATHGVYCANHVETSRQAALDSTHKVRKEVLAHYCGDELHCMCPGCHTTYWEFLQLDHVDGRGREHLRKEKLGMGGVRLWAWIRDNGYPDDFQVLCVNCNFTKGVRDKCPMHGKEH